MSVNFKSYIIYAKMQQLIELVHQYGRMCLSFLRKHSIIFPTPRMHVTSNRVPFVTSFVLVQVYKVSSKLKQSTRLEHVLREIRTLP